MNNLVKIDPSTVQMFTNIASSLAMSGFFPTGGQYQAKTREEQTAQAFVKIMRGHALGIDPITSMEHIHVIDGKTCLDATLVAGKIKGSGKYDYLVESLNNKGVHLTFWEMRNGEWVKIGDVTWDETDARRAGLLNKKGDMYNKYPRDMYFGRGITFGARRFCPDVFLGPIYTPEELGADIASAGSTEQATAPVQALTSGDGHATTAAPVAQLTAPAEPDYDRLLDKIATRLQGVASAPDEEWNKAYDGALEYVAGWPTQYRDEAQAIAAGIADARRLAMEDADERAAMQAE